MNGNTSNAYARRSARKSAKKSANAKRNTSVSKRTRKSVSVNAKANESMSTSANANANARSASVNAKRRRKTGNVVEKTRSSGIPSSLNENAQKSKAKRQGIVRKKDGDGRMSSSKAGMNPPKTVEGSSIKVSSLTTMGEGTEDVVDTEVDTEEGEKECLTRAMGLTSKRETPKTIRWWMTRSTNTSRNTLRNTRVWSTTKSRWWLTTRRPITQHPARGSGKLLSLSKG